MLSSCTDSNWSDNSTQTVNISRRSAALVQLWSFDGDEISKGTAPFSLYEDNGDYYVDFYGERCKLKRITPIDTDYVTLYYKFTSSKVGSYTYYLEDISDPQNRFFNN